MLTVIAVDGPTFRADVMAETLIRSSLGRPARRHQVNLNAPSLQAAGSAATSCRATSTHRAADERVPATLMTQRHRPVLTAADLARYVAERAR